MASHYFYGFNNFKNNNLHKVKTMTSRKNDFQLRKDRILAITIEQYIRTVAPVSSAFIVQRLPWDLSSATIRNILAELEEEGYLTHPHTSAGRIPTQKGYRYYVDNLMEEIQLLEDEKKRIKSEYESESRELELLLDKTSQVISDITHYTTIISVDGWNNKIFCRGTSFIVGYPDPQDIHKISYILNTLEEKEQLLQLLNQNLRKKIEIFIGQEIRLTEIENCSLVVSSYQSHRTSGRVAVLGPTRMDYERVVSAVDYMTHLMKEVL